MWKIEEVSALSGEALADLSVCLGCKICASVCPLNDCGLEVNPRSLLTSLLLGEPISPEDPLVRSCMGCYRCTEECPWGIRVPEVLRALRTLLGVESAFGKAFRCSVDRFGRVYEPYLLVKILPFLLREGYAKFFGRWMRCIGLSLPKKVKR